MGAFKTGKTKKGNLMHYSVGALIKKGEKFLLIDRAQPPFGFAGIAGHIDKGEKKTDALKREIKEESGLEVKNYKLLFEEELDWNWCNAGVNSHYWYLFKCSVSGKLKMNHIETKSIGWYTKSEIKKLKLEPVWRYWFKKLNII
jgi:ADP-ribose pyrophosphatase YjhB (NUDIX family)